MVTNIFDSYKDAILNFSASTAGFDERLLMERDGALSVYYAPFEYVNPAAKVVVVGITPGRTQMTNALCEAQRLLKSGAGSLEIIREAKQVGAFSGPLRNNLVNLLDHVGIHRWLGIDSTTALFGSAAHLVQTASVLCYPVFVNGKDYSGAPNMLRHPMLRKHLLGYFGQQAKRLPGAVFVPLGDKPSEALVYLAEQGVIDRARILYGLPHPSGANAERIAYFLGTKKKEQLSSRTNPDLIDRAKAQILARISAWEPVQVEGVA